MSGKLIIIPLFLIVAIALAFVLSPQPVPEMQVPNLGEPPITTAPPVVLEQDLQLLHLNANILEVLSGHAWQNHGTEVNDAIKCLNKYGSTKSFKTFGFIGEGGKPINTNLWLCFDGNDWYAVVTTTLEKIGGNRIGRLITAYMVDPKKFMIIDDFIEAIKNKWKAAEINFIIEAGTVYLQPR